MREKQEVEQKYRITSKQYVEGGLQLRVISEIQPELECMSIPATLEDAYIYVTNPIRVDKAPSDALLPVARCSLNICGEKVCIILAFYKTYKPAIYILPVHSSGSVFHKFSIFRGGKMDGILTALLAGVKLKLFRYKFFKSSTCSTGEIFKDDCIQ